MPVDVRKLKSMASPSGMDFHIASGGRVRPAVEWHGVRSLEKAIANPVPGQDTHLPR
jgi:hypothetical protein